MLSNTMTVKHRSLIQGELDAHGNEVESWSDPVEVPVYGVGPASEDDATREQGTGVKIEKTLWCSTGFASHRDKIIIPGDPREYDVVGYPQDFNMGPFGFAPGFAIHFGRVDG